MMQTIYLVDHQQINSISFSNAGKGDCIFICYGEDSSPLQLDSLRNLKANILVHKVTDPQQSIEKHLLAYLSYTIGQMGSKFNYKVITDNPAYVNSIEKLPFLVQAGVTVASSIPRASDDPSSVNPTNDDQSDEPFDAEQEHVEINPLVSAEFKAQLVGNLSKVLSASESADVADQILQEFSTTYPKGSIYHFLLYKFGQSKGIKVYNAVKELF